MPDFAYKSVITGDVRYRQDDVYAITPAKVHAREIARSYILMEMVGLVVARVVRDDEVGRSNLLTPTNYLLNSSNI